VNAAKRFFPTVSCCYEGDKRFTLEIGDAVKYISNIPDESVDVVIVDSTDPAGPAEGLFSPVFYKQLHRVLKPGGIVCSQGECLWVHADLIDQMCVDHSKPFASCEYASIQVPTYPSGQIGAFLCQKGAPGLIASCRMPRRKIDVQGLRYYSQEMHTAAFALPAFLQSKLHTRP